MSGEGATDDDVVDDWSAKAPDDNAFFDALEVHPFSFAQRAAFICEFLIDTALF